MKFIFVTVLMLLAQSQATVAWNTKAYIVVKHAQLEEYFVERVPVIGCYGVAYGTQLVQFTSSYKVSSNIGCGGDQFFEEINYLTCAKVTATKESKTGSTLESMTLDISNCDDKDNPQLITMIKTAAKMNFPQQKGEINLKIVSK